MVSGLEECRKMSAVKDAMVELVQQLPEECTWDDVMYRVFVRQKIDAGLKDADEGRTIPHEEVFQEFAHDDDPLD
jgi:predicted transcriptional regulator